MQTHGSRDRKELRQPWNSDLSAYDFLGVRAEWEDVNAPAGRTRIQDEEEEKKGERDW